MERKKPDTFGRRLKEYRQRAGLTQEQLAEELDTSVSNVRGWESGKWFPQIQAIMCIAYFFGSDLNEMLCWEEYMEGRDR